MEMRQRETNENLTAQIERLTIENAELSGTIIRLQQPAPEERVNVKPRDIGAALVSGLVRKFDNANNDVKLPKFSDETIVHPNKYLDKLEKYFTAKGTSESTKLEIVERSLEGHAEVWYDANVFESFAAFRIDFLKEYNSVQCQAKLKSKCLQRKYMQQDGTLLTYFYDQISIAHNFEPKYPTF